ncbi:MAG: FecR family protein [Butyricimonas faecalis]
MVECGIEVALSGGFHGEERKVEMEGEVYFEVAKNREKPFIVTVNGVDIRVLGTSFNVSAYQEEVVTTLVEGKVQLKRGDEQVVLSPNQQAIWSDDKFKVKQLMPVIMCYGKREFLF